MVDVNRLRKKFPPKDKKRSVKSARIKAIAREFELKKAELGVGGMQFKRGFPYYMVILMGMMMLGALVIPKIMSNGSSVLTRESKKLQIAESSVKSLAIALGRYRYHVGNYPTSEEGLEQLARKDQRIPGWNGPYISKLKNDPWGREYIYSNNGDAELPTLYSAGPDGAIGTQDDVVAKREDFDAPFKDTSWTIGWVPQHLRGYVLVQNEKEREAVQKEVEKIRNPEVRKLDEARRALPETMKWTTLSCSDTLAKMQVVYDSASGERVTNEFDVAMPIPWKPSRPFLHHTEIAGEEFAFPIRTVSYSLEKKLFVVNAEELPSRIVRLVRPENNADVLRHKLLRLKDMGANAIDVSNLPIALSDYCDQIGLLVCRNVPSDDVALESEVLDTLGIPTDIYYKLKAKWNPDENANHLSIAWEGVLGEKKKISLATSCDEAELFVNNKSMGRKRGAELSWDVEYEPGSLKAIIYSKGRYVGEVENHTPSEPYAVVAKPDRKKLAHGEFAVVEIEVQDKNGTTLYNTDEPQFAVKGPGEIVEVRRDRARAVVLIRRTERSSVSVELVSSQRSGIIPAKTVFTL